MRSNESLVCSNDLLIRPNESFICLNDLPIPSNDLLIRPNEEIFLIWPLYAAFLYFELKFHELN